MARILVLHGPNLNLTGTREPEIYGSTTLNEINQSLTMQAAMQDHELSTFQSNHEGEIIDTIQAAARDRIGCLLLNAGAYTHTSIAIRDALLATQIPFYEVHLSDPSTREPYRHHSYLCDIALAVFKGNGAASYTQALEAANDYLKTHKDNPHGHS